MNNMIGLFLALACGFSAGCAAPVKGLYPPPAGGAVKTVYVISQGWHTGIALGRADVAGTNMTVLRDFPHADYLEFGWGDAAYYPAARPTLSMALKALFWPTPSVLYVAGIRGALTNAFSQGEIISVRLSEAGFERLQSFLEKSFRRDPGGNLVPTGPRLYGEGRFYQAEGKFYFPKMCNWWTASGLRAAGCPVVPICTVSAGCVMSQTRRFGKVIRRK